MYKELCNQESGSILLVFPYDHFHFSVIKSSLYKHAYILFPTHQDSPGETPDPIDDSLGNSDQESGENTAESPSDRNEDSGVAAPTEPKTNLKKVQMYTIMLLTCIHVLIQ